MHVCPGGMKFKQYYQDGLTHVCGNLDFYFSPQIFYTKYNNYFRVQDIIHIMFTNTRAHSIVVTQCAVPLGTFYMLGKHRPLSHLLNTGLFLFSIKLFVLVLTLISHVRMKILVPPT